MQSIDAIADWLRDLRDSADAIKSAGVAAGHKQAAVRGFQVVSNSKTVFINFRGRRSMLDIPQAMREAMFEEFNRRAK